ncbi:hypothetical protein E3N88_44582 [Mikania micrantha]|nr:hypothetical protein E3N88_44582 [Mikania micrantha]
MIRIIPRHVLLAIENDDELQKLLSGVTIAHDDVLLSITLRANNFDLMYEQVKALKDGIVVEKPIYNHVSGLLDPSELIKPPKILVIEGLHPMYDQRVRALLDFSIYLDISNDVKFAWKIQRDLAERGHNLKSIKASIEARKPDFDAYIGNLISCKTCTLSIVIHFL